MDQLLNRAANGYTFGAFVALVVGAFTAGVAEMPMFWRILVFIGIAGAVLSGTAMLVQRGRQKPELLSALRQLRGELNSIEQTAAGIGPHDVLNAIHTPLPGTAWTEQN